MNSRLSTPLAVGLACLATLPAWGFLATPSRLDFAPQAIGTPSPPQSILVSALGAGESVVAITVPDGFLATSDCIPRTGPSCTIEVRFAPATQEPVAGNVAIQWSSAGVTTVQNVPVTGSGERSLVTHYYQSILRRAPDAGGKAFWESEGVRLERIGGNPEEALFAMAGAFFWSPEYQALQRNDAGFVEDLYRAFFLRAPDSGGLAYWTGQLQQGMPREILLTSFLLSGEFRAVARRLYGTSAVRKEVDAVMDFYRGMLARLPDDGGLDYWVAQFRAAQCVGAGAVAAKADEISAAFLSSPEYGSRGRSNPQFVGDLYNAFLRRGGDLAGVQYWIGQLDQGIRSREQLRAEFLASAEFSARVAQVVAEGCHQGGDSQTGLEGSFRYAGAFPQPQPVTYVDQDGRTITHPRAYPGFVMLHASFWNVASVATNVQPYGGTVVAAIPLAGQFMVKVPQTGAFIAAIRGLSWVEGAWPLQPLEVGARLLALDTVGSPSESACGRYHAPYVAEIMGRRSATPASFVDVGGRDALEISWELGYRMYESQRRGERLIVNISMQSASSATSCQPDACEAAEQGQLEFLRSVVKMMEINANVRPERADNTLVTVIAGNAGAQLDLELKLLKLRYPKGFERVLVVGGATPGSLIDVRFNHLQATTSRDMLYARSEDVQVGGTTCDGTSFAAPEVASVLDDVWSRRPDLSSDAILKALRDQMAANNTSVVPQDANGRTLQAFLDQVVARLPLPACTYTYSSWGQCQPNGTQTRTVISVTPAQCQGTPVLQQACTYVPPPPPCTYTYSAWSQCVNGQQTRTVLIASPAGCTGTPVVTQSCSNNACCACTFDVYCTVFGQGGCWYCSQGSIVNQQCTASGALVSPGACNCDPSLYTVCR